MPTSLSSAGLTNADTNVQSTTEGIVKVGFTSSGSRDFSAGNGFGPQWQYAGSEVAMGVPANSNNWYRIRYQTICLLYTSPSPRDRTRSRMPSSA